jgi:hypothetical protein
MSQQKLLTKLVQVLDANRIEYMLTGSIASSLQGEPRSTHDIDIVVSLERLAPEHLKKAFPPPEYYLDEATITAAATTRGMFNLIDVTEGDKIDFWVLTDEPFDRSRFARRITETVLGIQVKVSAPEDTILAKLKWAQESGGSEKQFTDALRVYEVQHDTLDTRYIKQWVEQLHLGALWTRVTSEAQLPKHRM